MANSNQGNAESQVGSPDSIGSSSKKNPIGVPKGYTTPAQFISTPVGDIPIPQGQQWTNQRTGQPGSLPDVGPRYYAGDEWVPGHTYSPAQIATLQQMLINAGFLKKSDAVQGSWDQKSANAYKQILSIANSQGVSWQVAMGDRLQATGGTPPTKATGPVAKLAIRLTDPADITAVVQKVAQSLYGGNLPQQDVDQFVANYHAAETASQTGQAQAKQAGGGSFYMDPTTGAPRDVTQAATDYIKTTFPGQVAGTAVGENFSKFQQMLTQSMPGGETQANR